MIRTQVTWGLGDILNAILLTVLVYATGILFAGLWMGLGLSKAYAVAIAGPLIQLCSIVVVIWVAKNKGANLWDLGIRKPYWWGKKLSDNLGTLLKWVLGFYIIEMGVYMAYFIMISLLGLSFLEPSQDAFDAESFDHGIAQLMLFVTAVVGAPLSEELLVRGFIFPGLTKYMKVIPAAIVSGLIFSSAHLEPTLIIPFGLTGAILAIAYERSKSLWIPICIHALSNSIAMILLTLEHM